MLSCSVELWREALHHHLKGLVVNVVAISGAALILRANAPAWFTGWVALSLGVTVLRVLLYLLCKQALRRAPMQAPARGLVIAHAALVLCAGSLWGALGWWGMPAFSGAQQFAILVMLSSLAGGATGTLAALRVSGKLYVLLLVVPACVRILALGNDTHMLLSLMGVMFAWVMISSHQTNHTLLIRTITLARDKAELADALSAKTEQVLKINSELEGRVAARTRELEHLARHDALTDLLNRRGMLAAEPTLRIHSGAWLLMVFIDLDHFKQINDGLGHDWGDWVLCEVGQRLTTPLLPEQARSCPTLVSRWGGDEFVLCQVWPSATPGDAQRAAHALHARLTAPCVIRGRTLRLGASLGVDLTRIDADLSLPAAISRADLAASEAKRLGRGRVVVYQPQLYDQQQRKLALGVALNTAHRDDSLRLNFQPVVRASDGQPATFEALLRWQPSGFGPVSPDEFIPLAEESDHILRLGDWALRQACLTAVNWPADSTGQAPRVAVNTSIRQLVRADFADSVAAALAASGLPPARLVLEVTETVFDDNNLHRIRDTLATLHPLGVEIHLDDFGTGYSSLSRLCELPLHAIKIDKHFVLSTDPRVQAVIEGAVHIAHRFGLRVIAEGVESAASASQLAQLGVDELQGYFFGRPQPHAQMVPVVWPTLPSPSAGLHSVLICH